jgi:signal transduction histidine kinase
MVKKTFDQTSDYRVLESQIVYKQTHLGRLAITYNVNRILQEAALQQEALHRHQIQTEAQVWENASGRIYRSAVLFGLLLLLMAGVTVGILLYLDRQVRRKSDELAAINEQLEKRVKEEVKKNRDREQMMIEQSKMAAMGEMIGAIAHQWRQPLNALGLYIQDVREAYAHHEMDGVYIEKMVDDSMNQINYMSKTIDDFRNFFKPSKMKTRFGVKESVEEVLNLLRPQLKSNAVGEVVIEAEGEESIVNGYKNEFEQVILNLLSNAKDAFWEAIGKGIITPQNSRIVIAITQKGAEVTVAVRDNAGGVAPEIIGRIFEPYFTTKEQGKGTGIGLYMSKTIIEKNMGGTIAAENIETDGLLGTQIVITLPLETHSADK